MNNNIKEVVIPMDSIKKSRGTLKVELGAIDTREILSSNDILVLIKDVLTSITTAGEDNVDNSNWEKNHTWFY